MYGSPDWPLSSVNTLGEATLRSSVGVKLGSALTSSGLLTFEAVVKSAGTGRVGSRPAGYERGSVLRILEREEFDEATEEVMSLPPEELEKVDASESRERHDEPEEDDELVLEVAVDMKDEATELRPGTCKHVNHHKDYSVIIRVSSVCENIRWIIWGGCLANSASMCRMDSSGMSRSSILAKNPGV
jgi:hypothetical protein